MILKMKCPICGEVLTGKHIGCGFTAFYCEKCELGAELYLKEDLEYYATKNDDTVLEG